MDEEQWMERRNSEPNQKQPQHDIMIFGSCRVHGIPYKSYRTHKPFDLLHTTKHVISNLSMDVSNIPPELFPYISIKDTSPSLPKDPSFLIVEHCSRKIVYDNHDTGVLYNCNRIGTLYHIGCKFDNATTKYFVLNKDRELCIPSESLDSISLRYYKDTSGCKTTHMVQKGVNNTPSFSVVSVVWNNSEDAIFFPWIDVNRRVWGSERVVLTLTLNLSVKDHGYFIRWYNGVSYKNEPQLLSSTPTAITLQTPLIQTSRIPALRISICTRDTDQKQKPVEILIHDMSISLSPNQQTTPVLLNSKVGVSMTERKQSLPELLQDTLHLKQLYPNTPIVFVPHIRVPTNDHVMSIVMKSREKNQELLEQVCSYFKECYVFPLETHIRESMLEDRRDGKLDINHYNIYGKDEIGKQLNRFLNNLMEDNKVCS